MQIPLEILIIGDALRLYWMQYTVLVLCVTASTIVQLRNIPDKRQLPGITAVGLAWSGVVCSFLALLTYYVFVHLYFPVLTRHLDIASKLNWLEFVEGGEVLIKLLGLLLPMLYFLWVHKKGTLAVLGSDKARLGGRALVEMMVATLVIGTLVIITLSALAPERQVLIVGNSGLAYGNWKLNIVVSIGAIVGSEVYFRRLLLEPVLDCDQAGTVLAIGIIWCASALFLTLNWPYALTALIISGGATLLYIRWRSLIICMLYQLLLTIPAVMLN